MRLTKLMGQGDGLRVCLWKSRIGVVRSQFRQFAWQSDVLDRIWPLEIGCWRLPWIRDSRSFLCTRSRRCRLFASWISDDDGTPNPLTVCTISGTISTRKACGRRASGTSQLHKYTAVTRRCEEEDLFAICYNFGDSWSCNTGEPQVSRECWRTSEIEVAFISVDHSLIRMDKVSIIWGS